jgi:hypothetical protein
LAPTKGLAHYTGELSSIFSLLYSIIVYFANQGSLYSDLYCANPISGYTAVTSPGYGSLSVAWDVGSMMCTYPTTPTPVGSGTVRFPASESGLTLISFFFRSISVMRATGLDLAPTCPGTVTVARI